MSKFLLFAALLIATPAHGETVAERLRTLNDREPYQLSQAFDCRNVSCKRLSSCAEACYKLTVCGQRQRDGDGDGIPCENLCSSRC